MPGSAGRRRRGSPPPPGLSSRRSGAQAPSPSVRRGRGGGASGCRTAPQWLPRCVLQASWRLPVERERAVAHGGGEGVERRRQPFVDNVEVFRPVLEL